MTLALAIVVIAVTAITGIAVLALFVWGAVKDGEDNERMKRRRPIHRRWPPRDTT